MEEKVIVEIILILISAGVIAYVILGPGSGIASSSDREVCRASVVAKWAATKIPLADDIFQLNCKSHLTAIKGDSLPKSSSAAEDYIKRQVANEMYDCWYEFNRGQLKLDSVLTVLKSSSFWGSKKVCIVCADITFDKSVSENYPIITGFNNWTINNTVPEQDYTYYDYFTNNLGEDVKEQVKARPVTEDEINTSRDYQVVFYVHEGTQTWLPNAIGMIFGPAGVQIAQLTQSGKYTPALLMIPVENTPEYCKTFY
ncbi:hypothetical protein COT07_01060 [Candidatus Woesearchaeota archaeon CG07_land_8_20_14_0_80_44_23]|nr:MAG: hypothetical protein COT07_01060 [Candidatus Woesearchaeota archaeon CG07_land_8_20_14_0_80_44_23]